MKTSSTHKRTKPAATAGRVRVSFYLPADLVEACRDAVVALSGPPQHLTLGSLANGGLRKELARLQRQAHGGRPFPARRSALRVGRPIK